MTVISPVYYTHNPSAKTITFIAPYNTLTAEEILSIRNLSKQIMIYNSSDPRHNTSMLRQDEITQTFDIQVSGGILTYVVTAGMASSDQLLIDINSNLFSSPVNVTNLNLLGQSDVVSVFSSLSVAASTTESSTAQDLRNVTYANIYIKNAGSTSLTVNIYGSPDSTGDFKTWIGTTTLNSTTLTQDEISIAKCPNYIFIDTINSDPDNSATVSITIQRTVSSDVIRPYSDILSVYSSETVAISTTITSTAQDVRGASYIYPYIKNTGSTDLTVNIYGSPDSAGTIKTLIRPYDLNTTVDQAGTPIEKVPNYIIFEIVNNDDENTTTVDISVQRN